MTEQEYTALADQVSRQTPELSDLDAQIAAAQPGVDALQAAFDAAQSAATTAEAAFTAKQDEVAAALKAKDESLPTLQAELQALTGPRDAADQSLKEAMTALAEPKAALDGMKTAAAAIRAALAQCQQEMADSGLTVDVDAQRLATAKAAMWERIKAERDRRKLEGGYTAAGKWFHSDTFSRTQQIGLVILANSGQLPPNTPWKTMSGDFVVMTPTLAAQVFGAAAMQDMATFAAAEAHKAAMEASADPAAYQFTGGWPAIFTG